MNKEARINFATTQYIRGITRHATGMIFAHPLQVVRIVTASFKLASVPRPKTLALSAEHLITTLGFVNWDLAIGTGFGVGLEKRDRSDSVRIANMMGVVAIVLKFPAVSTRVFVTSGAFPSGRDEAIAVGISTTMNELIGGIGTNVGRVMPLQLTFCLHEIILEGSECLDLGMNVLDLIVNVLDQFVMSDGGLSGREHGLFLSEENVLLMLCEFASEERLREPDVLKLRMSELCVAEHALGNRHIIATEEDLKAFAACGVVT